MQQERLLREEVKLQELPNQVPIGHIPRTLTVHCRGDCTRQATPGDDARASRGLMRERAPPPPPPLLRR